MEILKLENNRITIKKPIETFEEKTFSLDYLNKKIPVLQKELDRRQAQVDEIKQELDLLIEAQNYVKEKGNIK